MSRGRGLRTKPQQARETPEASVPLGLLVAGITVTSGLGNLIPKWLVAFGLVLAACGEASWISLLFPKALFLIPLTRFPGFIWLILAGFILPKSAASIELAKGRRPRAQKRSGG